MYIEENLNIELVDTIFNPAVYGPDAENIKDDEKYKVLIQDSDPALYKVWLFLRGNDLPFVESVTYILHETFPDPILFTRKTPENRDCRVHIWTWGIFEITAEILDNSGRKYSLTHNLTYGEQLEKLTDRIEFVWESPEESSSGATLI